MATSALKYPGLSGFSGYSGVGAGDLAIDSDASEIIKNHQSF